MWVRLILGLALGSAAGVATVTLASAASQQAPVAPRAVLDATHLPPLLTLPGERVDLSYDVHCAANGVEDVDVGCRARGAVFVRASGSGSFEEVPLGVRWLDGGRQLAATIPDSLASRQDGFEYYAVLEAPDLGESITLPAGGRDAPHVSRRLENAIDVPLGRHAFDGPRRVARRVAFARWGTGPTEAGLEQGRNLVPIGASAFDVEATGTVIVLDQANHRMLHWRKGARAPVPVPLSVAGTLADMTAGNDGSIFVLETTPRSGRNPLVRRFDDGGRELEAVETAERSPAQIRMGPSGPLVLGHASHHWMPLSVNGTPASPADQLRHGRSSRPLSGGGELIVFRHGNELRIALIQGRNVTESWRLTSDTSMAEVQLAEPMGQRLLVVVRLYDDRSDEFAVLILDRTGLVDRFTLDAADWAETAPLSRFRLVRGSLYQLGSTAAGMFVDRYTLEVN
jgi:hypothetical protein